MSTQLLAEIVEVAAELNRETDEFNAQIQRLEAALAEAGAGVSVWLPYALGKDATEGTAWELGYGKVSKEWRICVRKFRVGDAERGEDNKMPLVSISRAIRCQAAEHINELLTAIRDKMKGFAQDMARARAAVPTLEQR